jgi:4-hydroxy-tetrahydrodipicolinate reductase
MNNTSLNIALLGYGKMGKLIEEMSLKKGHRIVARIDKEEDWLLQAASLKTAHVAIEFSTPASAVQNIEHCFELNLPIIVGTTAWQHDQDRLKQWCISKGQALMWGSNFSIGVNLLFKLNQQLAQWMNVYEGYEVSIEEIHHTAKLDAPSGTAVSLAQQIIENLDRKNQWTLEENYAPDQLKIEALRIDATPGTHHVRYQSEIDDLVISHIAHNRKGFAIGAIEAAEWIYDKKGWFNFTEVFF